MSAVQALRTHRNHTQLFKSPNTIEGTLETDNDPIDIGLGEMLGIIPGH